METRLERVGDLKVVKQSSIGYILENGVEIVDTFAEMFPMWAGRVLVTADSEAWAMTAAATATGLATSVIMSPAEAGIEGALSADKTPDNRAGVMIQIYNRNRF
jgi:formylmethanofuran--tetrahydromethanopterin N-formyltransferase